ncbi:FAD-binding protein [Thermodesulfobacteriota bacterium]
MKSQQIIKTDILVIGSGGAGLRAAIEARERGCDVLLVSKSSIGRGNNTAIAGSAMAAATGWHDPRDKPEVHFKDTVNVGRFINDQRLVEIMVQGATQQICDLERFGVEFAKIRKKYYVMDIPSHSYPRVMKPKQGIGTGHTLPLSRYATSIGVRTMERVFITKLLKSEDVVVGAIGVGLNRDVFVFHSKSVILASGGLCQLFIRTSNVPGATGDGYVLGYEAGARLQDMEFIQFLPATLSKDTRRLFLYEAFIESGAVFKNSQGENIAFRHGMLKPHEMTRDRVARAIMLEIIEGRGVDGAVILDFSTIPEDKWEDLEEVRLRSESLKSLERKAYDIAPSAHFAMGGVKINENCEMGVDGLFAAGEICGGIHGANRLGPNAITDIFVFGTIAGKMASKKISNLKRKPFDQAKISSEVERLGSLSLANGKEDIEDIQRHLKRAMWHKGGIVRSEESLNGAMEDVFSARERLNSVRVDSPR